MCQVEVWRSNYKNFKKCRWFGGQNMANSKVIDISLGRHMILVTDLGYTYFGHFHKISNNNKEVKESSGAAGAPKIEIVSASAFSLEEIAEKYSKERKESEEVHLEKVPLIYRGLRCYTDWKTRTFAVVQDDPRIGYGFCHVHYFLSNGKRICKSVFTLAPCILLDFSFPFVCVCVCMCVYVCNSCEEF